MARVGSKTGHIEEFLFFPGHRIAVLILALCGVRLYEECGSVAGDELL